MISGILRHMNRWAWVERRSSRILLSVMTVAAIVGVGWAISLVLDRGQLSLAGIWLIFGLLTLSLDVVWGYGGIFSFGQTALFGTGGYAFGVLSINFAEGVGGGTWVFLAGATLAGAIMTTALGYFLFFSRLGEFQVAIVTLIFALILGIVATGVRRNIGEAVAGGANGMTKIPPLSLGMPGMSTIELGPRGSYLVILAICAIAFESTRFLKRSRYGRIVRAVQTNEVRAELLGYDVRAYRLAVFVVGGAIAGLAGGLFASQRSFINPSVFSLFNAALVVIWLLVGGRGTLIGAFLGAFIVNLLSFVLGGSLGSGQSTLILGLLLIGSVLFFRGGIIGSLGTLLRKVEANQRISSLGRWRARKVGCGPDEAAYVPDEISRKTSEVGRGLSLVFEGDSASPPEKRVVLDVQHLSKAFGGLTAVADVSLSFEANSVYCMIGPNGAGKSTFFNLMLGRLRPDKGRVLFDGTDISAWQPHRRVRAGIGAKLQVPSVFGSLTVFENVWLASLARHGTLDQAQASTCRTLETIGLLERAAQTADSLAHGYRQWLEIGMVMAMEPKVVLLDEPSAGMTRNESDKLAEMIGQLARASTVIVVEHDIEFLRGLGAPTVVLHQGELFAQGTVEELRQDARVLDIYLGRTD